jgi:hypothetical protein
MNIKDIKFERLVVPKGIVAPNPDPDPDPNPINGEINAVEASSQKVNEVSEFDEHISSIKTLKEAERAKLMFERKKQGCENTLKGMPRSGYRGRMDMVRHMYNTSWKKEYEIAFEKVKEKIEELEKSSPKNSSARPTGTMGNASNSRTNSHSARAFYPPC